MLVKRTSLMMNEKWLLWSICTPWETVDRILGNVAKVKGLAKIIQSIRDFRFIIKACFLPARV